MTHLERYNSFGPVYLAPWGIENMRASRKLAKWSDMCEAAEAGVAIPGFDQTLIMWAIRRGLRDTRAKARHYFMDGPGVMISFEDYRCFHLFVIWDARQEISLGGRIAGLFKREVRHNQDKEFYL